MPRASFPRLSRLNLSHNNITLLYQILFHPQFGMVSDSLKSLTIVNCNLEAAFASDFTILGTFLPNLTHLDMSGNRLLNIGLHSITNAFQ